MTTNLGKSCSFGLLRVPCVNCRQFMYLVISLLVLRAGCGIWLYQFLIIAYHFTLKVLTELKCRRLAAKTGQKSGSGTSHLTKNWQSRSAERVSCHIIGSQAKWKCGSRVSDLWQSCQVGRVEAELYIFYRSLSYWLPLPMLTNNSTDCYNCHSQWWTMWRPGVAKAQDFRNALDKVSMLPQRLWVILIWTLS